LESLNHLTVPVAIKKHLPLPFVNGRWEAHFAGQILALDLPSVAAFSAARATTAPAAEQTKLSPD
jgi:hypothetical protein